MNEQVVTCKLRLYPDADQRDALEATARAYMGACNRVSGHAHGSGCYVQARLHDELYYGIRSDFGLGSQMACSTIRTVLAAYKSMRENAERRDEDPDDLSEAVFKHPFYDLVRGKDYTLKPGSDIVSVATLEGRAEMPYSAKGMEGKLWSGRLGGAKVVYKHGRFYLHVSVKFDVAEPDYSAIANVVGVDRGERFLLTAYDSKGKCLFVSGKGVRARKQHYRRVRKSLQKKNTPSARRRLKAIGRRENRWVQDVNHCAAKALVGRLDRPTLIAVEDLKGFAEVIAKRDAETVKEKKRKDLLVAWSQYDLLQKIEYKAALAGHVVVSMNPVYTSQACPKCGHIEKANRVQREHRFECCNCGYRSNDDRVAGMNLQTEGIQYLKQRQSDMLGLDGATVNRPTM